MRHAWIVELIVRLDGSCEVIRREDSPVEVPEWSPAKRFAFPVFHRRSRAGGWVCRMCPTGATPNAAVAAQDARLQALGVRWRIFPGA